MNTRLASASLVSLFLFVAAAPAMVRAQIAPRIAIGFDTSGSMATDLGGIATFGDGMRGGCVDTDPSPTREVMCGTNCTAGIDTNCDGIPNDSRIQIAKLAVTNMVLAFGDVDWSLARFAQNQGTNLFCDRIQAQECNAAGPFVSSMGNPQCNSLRVVPNAVDCIWNWPPLWPAACRPGTTAPTMFTARASDPTVCINYAGACDVGGSGGDVLVGFPNMGAYGGVNNTYGILRWLDNAETNFQNSRASGNFCQVASGVGDCELRASGPTPLAGLLNSLGAYMTPIRAADPAAACRPYSVILLTDGAQSAGCLPNDPVVAAAALRAAGILTYVVGFATGAADATQLNAIATAGGTDAGPPGGNTAFFATNQVELAAGLSDIVRRSLRIEICNGVDDDCDTLIDEGVTNACGGCGAVPVEVCNGLDDDCDGTVDDGVANACGFCGPVPPEVCNRLDDDCDGAIDEDGMGGDICAGCVPTAEICDGRDNDCDGTIDEGVTRACGSAVGECRAGTQTCVVGGTGTWGACVGSIGPTMEVCDNRDNDCDGSIDGMSRPCGSSVGECVPGNEVCIAGSYGACIGAVGPTMEICDGQDDDCDGAIDEGIPPGGSCGSAIGICMPGTLQCLGGRFTCVGGRGPDPSETCNGLDDDCDGLIDESIPTMGPCGSSTGECRPGARTCVGGAFVCVGATGPVTEVCNTRDDDCDGMIDEGNPGGGAACGSSVGECRAGTTSCVGGALSCVGSIGPSTEICNLLDDNCNGLVDEGNPGGGASCGATDVGACSFGAQACVMGSIRCIGERGPSPELCDGIDNDCDGMIDEGDPEGGGACGDDTGECSSGTFRCVMGSLTCMGGVGPTMEICDGLDNDCDGVIDDGIPVGAPCGTDVGECVPGRNVCRMGAIVCEGGIPPETEVCDNLDNDCDGMIDEGLGLGGPCGSSEGLCMPGTERCISGRLLCEGEVGPSRETCDCADNDCDGMIDEPPMTGTLCPPGSTCFDCQCALPCMMSEFGFICPTGRAPRQEGGMCFCVAERCDTDTCAAETRERDGETLCAPGDASVSACVCKNNDCTFPCDGVVCMGGTVCDPRDPLGRCVENSCRGLGCPAGEICDVMSGACMNDPCETAMCASDQACRSGTCEGSCAGVVCGEGEVCHAGGCDTDPCFGRVCAAGEVCDAATGDCVDDLCLAVRCASGQVCELSTGNCVADPCTSLRCPVGAMCEDGECVEERMMGTDAGTDAGIDGGSGDERDRVLAAGGCSCRVGPAPDHRDGPPWLLLMGLLGLLVYRARRRRLGRTRGVPLGLAVGIAAAATLLGGCDVDPFCLDCAESPGDAGDAGFDAGAREAGTDAGTDAATDAGVDACVEESCNGLDDDCDGEIDEDYDLDTDVEHCGACDALCAPIGAFPACRGGICEIDSCDVGRLDLDMDPVNGCEYRCLIETPDDAVCDLRDNDCDGEVDEDVDTDVDTLNCGSCGIVCVFPHAGASCAGGMCVVGTCDPNFFDVDGNPTNGCEYACTAATPPVEVCNLADDDCDGMIDEGNPGGGSACGSSTGSCRPGVEACVGGTIQCMGATTPTTETCDGLDNDCDAMTDEGNPDGGRVCGTSAGTCAAGREVCTGGSLVCTGAIGPGTEVCDGLDNDCDAMTDEGNPGGGAGCGSSTGACRRGTETCTGGVITCSGATGPVLETCNSIDDDCDGMTDEGNPGGGAICGTDVGTCSPGTMTCVGGTVTCVGGVGPRVGGELCNSLDDDCDGMIDEGNPGGGGPCGITTGECSAGVESCVGGTLQCMGGVGPRIETCNSRDDDCDGMIDENFDFANDRNNCGGCGTICSFANAVAGCSMSSCVILACNAGFFDADRIRSTGCEYACSFTGSEICNGADDNCDGRIDELLTPPDPFCNPNGVCAGTIPTCAGAAGWVCTYGGTYQPSETRCDGRDNDCDGAIDEPFPSLGAACGNGTGACRSTGIIACLGSGAGTYCTAGPAGMPGVELCNNLDDDCDGMIDESLPLSSIPTVNIGGVRVMQYEASRPDATAAATGTVGTHACSNPNVLPWTNVTWTEARNACCALNPSGTCAATGWRLCDSTDWQRACLAPSGSCTWSYMSSCSTSSRLTCNGEEYDSDPGMSGDQDAVFPTASLTFGTCLADWAGAGVIYDLSGNVKEWTNTSPAAGVHEIRGGAYNNVEPGRTCRFDFTVGDNSFAFPNTGFRCCYY